MKTLRLIGMTILVVMLAANFTACSDDDDSVGTTQDLVGRWNLSWTKGWEFKSNGSKYTWDEEDSGEDFIFSEDGNGVVKSIYSSDMAFTWSYINSKFICTFYQEKDRAVRILKLNATTLVLEVTDNQSQEINTYTKAFSLGDD